MENVSRAELIRPPGQLANQTRGSDRLHAPLTRSNAKNLARSPFLTERDENQALLVRVRHLPGVK